MAREKFPEIERLTNGGAEAFPVFENLRRDDQVQYRELMETLERNDFYDGDLFLQRNEDNALELKLRGYEYPLVVFSENFMQPDGKEYEGTPYGVCEGYAAKLQGELNEYLTSTGEKEIYRDSELEFSLTSMFSKEFENTYEITPNIEITEMAAGSQGFFNGKGIVDGEVEVEFIYDSARNTVTSLEVGEDNSDIRANRDEFISDEKHYEELKNTIKNVISVMQDIKFEYECDRSSDYVTVDVYAKIPGEDERVGVASLERDISDMDDDYGYDGAEVEYEDVELTDKEYSFSALVGLRSEEINCKVTELADNEAERAREKNGHSHGFSYDDDF